MTAITAETQRDLTVPVKSDRSFALERAILEGASPELPQALDARQPGETGVACALQCRHGMAAPDERIVAYSAPNAHAAPPSPGSGAGGQPVAGPPPIPADARMPAGDHAAPPAIPNGDPITA